MDVVVSVATNLLNKLVDEAILQACYPFRFNNYVRELEAEKQNLQSKMQGVQDRAKDAKKKTHKVVREVEEWLEKAESMRSQVLELQEKTEKRNKISCLKHFPNLISRYNLAKQLEEKTNEIKEHNRREFPQISRLATLPGMKYFSSQDLMNFDSRKEAYDRLLKAFEDDKIRVIGLWGMGGCGKTTLAKALGNEAEKFVKVLYVVVSNPIDVRKIQSSIAGQLGFKFNEEENLERVKRLFIRLTDGEKFLIILDDVWEKLQFEDIGIPPANDQMGCTTLITTRKFDVCKSMNCQEIIRLDVLNEDESWALFQKHADPPETLKDLAQKITEECHGLPVAITAVASALKDKTNHGWSEALKTLRDPNWIDIEEDQKSVYGCFRLSYDNLKNEVAKSLFLLCSVYPEDYEIQTYQLTMIGLGLGLARDTPSYYVRTREMNKAIKKLINSSLLLKVDEDGNDVRMHDLVRDVALLITKKENKMIMGQLKEDMIMKDNLVRYLWLENVDKCRNKLNCPELEFLYASIYSDPCVAMPNNFFNSMEKLRVLILKNVNYQEHLALQFPISLHMRNNLCCLKLFDWVLGDISFIGSLERLESLVIWGCHFDELPQCIIQLQKLRFLYLRNCEIQRNPFEVMGRCSQLEILYFFRNSGTYLEDQNKNSAEFFDKIRPTAPSLESYCIHFGNDFVFDEEFEDCKSFVARGLYIEDFENCISIGKSKDMMRRVKTLSLKRISRSLKNIIPDLCQTIGGGMNELTRLTLHDSDGIECWIGHANNGSQFGIISNLTHLTLTKVKHLKTLYSGQDPTYLFANLEELHIESCDSLECILKEGLKEMPLGRVSASYATAFPKLVCLEVRNCKKLKYLMPLSFAKSLSLLKSLTLEGNDELKGVFDQSFYEDLNLNKSQIVDFSALERLELSGLPNIISIYPENYHPTWPFLELLLLNNCPELNIKSINHSVACDALKQDDGQMSSKDLLKAVVAPLETLQRIHLFNDEIEVVLM